MALPKLTQPRTLRALAATTAAACLASCGNLINLNEKARQKRRMKELERLASASTTEARSRLGDKAAGEIVYADPTAGFVLIRPLTGLTIPTGTKLESRREARTTGELIITPERKGSFAAADVTSGSPQAGDAIIPTGSAKPPEPTPIAGSTTNSTPSDPKPPQPSGSTATNPLVLDPSTIAPEDLPDTIGNIINPIPPAPPPDSPAPPASDIPSFDER